MGLIFVFGSNLAGRHGKGAALFARTYRGAIYGQAEGLQGRSYAIPTKNSKLKSLSLEEIGSGVERFLLFAASNESLVFETTPIGTGLAGYSVDEIRSLFTRHYIPPNVLFTRDWLS